MLEDKGKSAEADWAGLWNKLGIEYEYEPHLFNLGPTSGFKPDFFFPASQTFVEVTVTRHVGRKNKKIKLARAQHPEYTFILLTRHEHRIIFGENANDLPYPRLEWHRLDSWTQAARNLAALICSITGETEDDEVSYPPPSYSVGMEELYVRVQLYGEPDAPVRVQARFENGVVLDTEITEVEANSLAAQIRVAMQIRQVARAQRRRLGTPQEQTTAE